MKHSIFAGIWKRGDGGCECRWREKRGGSRDSEESFQCFLLLLRLLQLQKGRGPGNENEKKGAKENEGNIFGKIKERNENSFKTTLKQKKRQQETRQDKTRKERNL